ncbi:Mth938-like domain-containing protein [Futiania mangrovi]|uniref:Mth938-like domain-containing protein n=1 Tax=Futiania mangrovi TaxID=2959716 RepID=A0A9J6PHA3_9PROT|nr:Mth938-like domain-containing protein [Futiania mangrovii]MCP1335967.1 Mth938-like domain-containing protein [Futiania mangrovii]
MSIRLEELVFSGQPPVDGYGDGGFRIQGTFHEGSLLLLPSGILPWGIADLGGLTAESLAPVREAGASGSNAVDVLLIGTGARIARPAPDVVADLEAQGIGVEFMDTGAACRTYNVLLSEARRVAAALIAVA